MLPGESQFAAVLTPAVEAVVPPDLRARALHDAWCASSGGRHVIGHNWWQIEGQGDAGWYDAVTLVGGADGTGDGSVRVVRYAKFSSPEVAASAWLALAG